MKTDNIDRLRRQAEACFGRPASTSRHFEELSESIFSRTGQLLSTSTLKRLWGYLDEPVTPRLHTLDTLSRYAGWPDWKEFSEAPNADPESGPIGRPHLDVRHDLRRGDRVRLSWAPDRVCEIWYLSDLEFEIFSARNTRLQAGDRFRCSSIISDAPLYLDHLTRQGDDLGVYVCGRRSGVRFAIIEQ